MKAREVHKRTAQISELCEDLYYTALKGIVQSVIPTELAAYTEDQPDRKIGAFLSAFGVYKRMCLDIIKVGGLSTVLIARKRQMKAQYLDKINQALKK